MPSPTRNVEVGGVRLERWWDKRMQGWEGPGPFTWRHPSAACTAWASTLLDRYALQPLARLAAMDQETLANPGGGRECARAYLWLIHCTLRELEGNVEGWRGWGDGDGGAWGVVDRDLAGMCLEVFGVN